MTTRLDSVNGLMCSCTELAVDAEPDVASDALGHRKSRHLYSVNVSETHARTHARTHTGGGGEGRRAAAAKWSRTLIADRNLKMLETLGTSVGI